MDEIENILTEEEMAILQKAQDKITKIFEESNTKKDMSDALNFEDKGYLDSPQPITNSPKEIIFILKGVAREINSDGTPSDTIEIVEQNYHIPVNNGTKYKDYMEKFLNKFRDNLQETCQEINNG